MLGRIYLEPPLLFFQEHLTLILTNNVFLTNSAVSSSKLSLEKRVDIKKEKATQRL